MVPPESDRTATTSRRTSTISYALVPWWTLPKKRLRFRKATISGYDFSASFFISPFRRAVFGNDDAELGFVQGVVQGDILLPAGSYISNDMAFVHMEADTYQVIWTPNNCFGFLKRDDMDARF
ncbi:hypothetical protein BHE90_004396 [Fusarium euwallaceae]|uniref:Uncharacterized protein n=1 Tax=Fusarium euwallaceae TaxID=1147111 RepID=A0A430LZG2_9HYPO|nr:hypothetical protein BHE90_004396 [Fusarium euwallaceae]